MFHYLPYILVAHHNLEFQQNELIGIQPVAGPPVHPVLQPKEVGRVAVERGLILEALEGGALSGTEGPGREPRFPAVPKGREGNVQDRPKEDEGEGPL